MDVYKYDETNCKKVYKNKTHLARHKLKDHSTKKEEHICPICNKTFSRKDKKNEHMKKKVCANRTCTQCKKVFTTTYGRDKHIKKNTCKGEDASNKNEKRKFPCKKCGKTFSIERYRDMHMKKVACTIAKKKKKENYKCSYCDKGYTRKQNRNRHMKNCEMDPNILHGITSSASTYPVSYICPNALKSLLHEPKEAITK